MKKMIPLLRFALLFLAAFAAVPSLGSSLLEACTTAVISGKFTSNGRPMIWKVRDTEAYANHIARFHSPLGYYIGLVNDDDPEGNAVWGGHNSSGFAIMNSASFNVNAADTASFADQEGIVMKRALAECRTLADFEALLESLPKPMGLAAHFGVIDARGGASFYEVNNYTWTKFDANEAPEGYLLRTNFSRTGTKDEGYGYVRYRSAQQLFSDLRPGSLTPRIVGSRLSRSMYHSLLKVDYSDLWRRGLLPGGSDYIDSDDLITRYDTSSMILVEGVKPGEDPALATSWVQIGNPYVSPLLPVWTGEEVPAALALPVAGASETVSQKSLRLKRLLYPLTTVEESRYLFLPLLYQKDGTGLIDRFDRIEAQFVPLISASSDPAARAALRDRLLAQSLEAMDEALATPPVR